MGMGLFIRSVLRLEWNGLSLGLPGVGDLEGQSLFLTKGKSREELDKLDAFSCREQHADE
jgi:hypothetical protein